MRRACFRMVLAGSLLVSIFASAESLETMQAVRYHANGPASVMKLETVPRPAAGPGEVLVRIAAAGVNPIEVQLRERSPAKETRPFPIIPGHDISGRVVALGAGADPSLMSKEVFALISWRGGAYAEYVAVPAALVVPKPVHLTHEQAAAVPLVALTAHQALFADGHLSKGQSVLIHGGSGGVGHMAIQLAKHAGARVLATASAENLEYIRSLGADVAIDYRTQRFEEVVRDVDLVLDTVGGETLKRSYGVIRSGGVLVSLLEQPDPALLVARGARGARTTVHPDRNDLQHIASLIDRGVLKPTVSMTYPLAEAAAAQDDLKRLHKPGKSVLIVQALDSKP